MFEATEVAVEPGAYRARLLDIEITEGKNFDTGEPEDQRKWTFGLLEEGFEGQTLVAYSSMSFGPKSKARKWVEGLLGRKIEAGDKVDLPELKQAECDLGVVNKETDRGSFAKIETVMPVRKKARGTEQAESKQMRDVRDGRAPVTNTPNDEEFDEIPF